MDEIENLRVLVDAVANKIAEQIKRGEMENLKELLWNVPTNVLAELLKRE